MKQKILLVLAMLLGLAGIQTAMAQTMTVHLANDEKVTYDVSQVDSVTFNKSGQQPQEDIIVTVDANGNADGGHHFDWIDNTNFYIDDVKYTAKDGNLVVTGYDPAFFQGEAKLITRLILVGRRMNVVEISEKAFFQCQVLKSVVIPKYVTSIGSYAFCGCSGLTSITIPNSVTSIGGYAFNGCTGLTSVHITDLVAWCNIPFGNTVANPLYYAHHLYLNGEEVKDLVIPEGVTNIGNYAFSYCSGLTSVTIPNSVTNIGNNAFYSCTGLTSVTIPNSVTRIGNYAFDGCTSLTSVTIPNSVTRIGNFAFDGCTSLTSVTIKAKTPPTIGYTFSNASNATLYVPTGCKAAYQAASYWKDFKEIIEIEMED